MRAWRSRRQPSSTGSTPSRASSKKRSGGRAFNDRAEIKDAASYLRLAINPKSDADLERVVNRPARGIGDATLARLQELAREAGISFLEALSDPARIPDLGAAAVRRLRDFRTLVEQLSRQVATAADAYTAAMGVLKLSGLQHAHAALGTDESQERAENLLELAGAAREFDRIRAEQPTAPRPAEADPEAGPLEPEQGALESFLEQINLLGDADSESAAGRVSVMTLHAAKGLELDAVYLTGIEEGVFPHSRALTADGEGFDPEAVAEERRLCYVGITRARRWLTFSLAQTRSLFGDLKKNDPSRFLSDVPRELFSFGAAGKAAEEERIPGETYVEREPAFGAPSDFDELDQRPAHERRPRRAEPPRRRQAKAAEGPLPEIGARVKHPSLGEGLVIGASGTGMNATVTVRFPGLGERRIVARFLSVVP